MQACPADLVQEVLARTPAEITRNYMLPLMLPLMNSLNAYYKAVLGF